VSELKDIVLISDYTVKESRIGNILHFLAVRVSQFAHYARIRNIMNFCLNFHAGKCNILILGFEGFIQLKKEVLS